ncbi:serine/threonine-protein phosphatase 6 regulatory ankyrin repeat subunit C-like, partial [Serinus canaria]|uniref:serine/threonine-protein phosphatase 6 regulatory ankyrin repeat subunit C-like n=1 Tax=Serinus canaria TaxID=9135 RepID=UPI0021CC5730
MGIPAGIPGFQSLDLPLGLEIPGFWIWGGNSGIWEPRMGIPAGIPGFQSLDLPLGLEIPGFWIWGGNSGIWEPGLGVPAGIPGFGLPECSGAERGLSPPPAGSEIDCADRFGNTPLHVAARYGHELLISTLMTNGADTARRGIHDMFPLHLAVLFGFSDCCRKLLSSGQLYSIVSSLSNEHVLSAGFDINTPDNLGRTCLHAAASGGNVECLNLLLSSGADLRRRDKFGRTPLHYAAANGSYQCTVTLVTAGAAVNEADGKGCTALHYAAASDTYRRAEAHSGPSEEEPLKESRLKEAF